MSEVVEAGAQPDQPRRVARPGSRSARWPKPREQIRDKGDFSVLTGPGKIPAWLRGG